MLTLFLLVCSADPTPPPFVVENKVPPFVVVNKIIPAVVPPVVPADPNKPAPDGFQWQKRAGEDWKLVPIAQNTIQSATPAVVAPRTFLSGGYNASHRCETCGRTVTTIAGPGPVPGTHWHVCPNDGTRWYH